MIIGLSYFLLLIIGISVCGGLKTRVDKGIGWQFIRYNVIVVTIPLLGILILNDKVTSEIALPIIAAALAYSFGKDN
jgi:hypothetical protein